MDYPDFEAIVVDDGSVTPEALAHIEALKQESFPFPFRVVHQPNRYLGAARNTGARNAVGEWVVFLDDDNCLFPDAIRRFVQAVRYSGADIVTGAMRCWETLEAPTPADAEGYQFYFLGNAFPIGSVRNVFGDATAIVRKSVFDTVQFHEHFGLTFEDWLFYANAALKGFKIVSMPEITHWYRVLPNS